MNPPLVVPTLTTARLALEPLGSRHSADMFALWGSLEVCRHSGPAADLAGRPIRLPAQTPDDSDKIIAFFGHGAASGQRFRWAMLTADGAFAGAVGFNSLGACSELAYHLHPAFWGRGLMTEAAQAALAWLRTRPNVVSVEAFIAPENAPSVRLALRLGMSATGETSNGAARYRMALSG